MFAFQLGSFLSVDSLNRMDVYRVVSQGNCKEFNSSHGFPLGQPHRGFAAKTWAQVAETTTVSGEVRRPGHVRKLPFGVLVLLT